MPTGWIVMGCFDSDSVARAAAKTLQNRLIPQSKFGWSDKGIKSVGYRMIRPGIWDYAISMWRQDVPPALRSLLDWSHA